MSQANEIWICPNCETLNPNSSLQCEVCQHDKVDSPPIEIPPIPQLVPVNSELMGINFRESEWKIPGQVYLKEAHKYPLAILPQGTITDKVAHSLTLPKKDRGKKLIQMGGFFMVTGLLTVFFFEMWFFIPLGVILMLIGYFMGGSKSDYSGEEDSKEPYLLSHADRIGMFTEKGSSTGIRSMRFHQGQLLLTVSEGGDIEYWDIQSGKKVVRFPISELMGGGIVVREAGIGHFHNGVFEKRNLFGKPLQTVNFEGEFIEGGAYDFRETGDNLRIAVTTSQGRIATYLTEQEHAPILPVFGWGADRLAPLSHPETRLEIDLLHLSASELLCYSTLTGEIRIQDFHSGKPLYFNDYEKSRVISMNSSHGKLVIGFQNGKIQVINLGSRKKMKSVELEKISDEMHPGLYARKIKFSENGRQVYLLDSAATLRIFSLDQKGKFELRESISTYEEFPSDLAVSSEQKWLSVGTKTGGITMFHIGNLDLDRSDVEEILALE